MSLLFLIGMPAAGKTYWGSRLAKEWNYAFTDLDTFIEQKENNAIGNIFAKKGEPYFRSLETTSLQEIINNHNENEIVACGGGTPCYNNNMQLMLANGCVVYLSSDTALLIKHLSAEHNKRPLFQSHTNIHQYLDELIKERKGFYESAHYTLNTENILLTDFTKIITECTNRH